MLATQNALNCNADATDSQGCGFRTHRDNTAGIGANKNGGGVYVLECEFIEGHSVLTVKRADLDDRDIAGSGAGIKAWMFDRDSVPKDLASKTPNPSSWTTPDMYISASSCNPSTYFSPQQCVPFLLFLLAQLELTIGNFRSNQIHHQHQPLRNLG